MVAAVVSAGGNAPVDPLALPALVVVTLVLSSAVGATPGIVAEGLCAGGGGVVLSADGSATVDTLGLPTGLAVKGTAAVVVAAGRVRVGLALALPGRS